MHIVAIAWIFVVVLMAAAEATSNQGTVLGALMTLLLYGALPLWIVMYLLGTPMRRQARRAAEAAADAEATLAGAAAAAPEAHAVPEAHPAPAAALAAPASPAAPATPQAGGPASSPQGDGRRQAAGDGLAPEREKT